MLADWHGDADADSNTVSDVITNVVSAADWIGDSFTVSKSKYYTVCDDDAYSFADSASRAFAVPNVNINTDCIPSIVAVSVTLTD